MSRWHVYTNPESRLECLQAALHALKDAQEYIRLAGAPYAFLKVKAARSSLEGAIRNAEGRTMERVRKRSRTLVKQLRRSG
jgi:hypothetical protein